MAVIAVVGVAIILKRKKRERNKTWENIDDALYNIPSTDPCPGQLPPV